MLSCPFARAFATFYDQKISKRWYLFWFVPLVSNSISYLLPDCTNFKFKLGAPKRYLFGLTIYPSPLQFVGTVTAKGPLALSEARAPTMSLFGMLRAFQQLSALSSPAAVASTVNNTRMPTGGRIVNVNAVPGALKVSADASSSATLALTTYAE